MRTTRCKLDQLSEVTRRNHDRDIAHSDMRMMSNPYNERRIAMFHPVSIEEVYQNSRNTKGYYYALIKEFMRSEHTCVKSDIPKRIKPNSLRISLCRAIETLGLKGSVHVHGNADNIYLIKSDKA